MNCFTVCSGGRR